MVSLIFFLFSIIVFLGVMVSVARILLAFCMVFTFPMECFVTRHCFLSIIEKILSDRKSSRIDYSEENKEHSLNGVEEPSIDEDNCTKIEDENENENENENGYFEGINPMTEMVILKTPVQSLRSSLVRQSESQISNDLNNKDFKSSCSSSVTLGKCINDINNFNVLSSSNDSESKYENKNYYDDENERKNNSLLESSSDNYSIKNLNSAHNDMPDLIHKNYDVDNIKDANDVSLINSNSLTNDNCHANDNCYTNDDNDNDNDNRSLGSSGNINNNNNYTVLTINSPISAANERSEIEEACNNKNEKNSQNINNRRNKFFSNYDSNIKNNKNGNLKNKNCYDLNDEELIENVMKIIDNENEINNFQQNFGRKEFENVDLEDDTVSVDLNNANRNTCTINNNKNNNVTKNLTQNFGNFLDSSSSRVSDSDIQNLKNSKINKGYDSNIYSKLKYNSYHPVKLIHKIINSEKKSFFKSWLCNCNCTKFLTFSAYFSDQKSFFRLIVTLCLWSSSVAIALIFQDLGVVLALTGK